MQPGAYRKDSDQENTSQYHNEELRIFESIATRTVSADERFQFVFVASSFVCHSVGTPIGCVGIAADSTTVDTLAPLRPSVSGYFVLVFTNTSTPVPVLFDPSN